MGTDYLIQSHMSAAQPLQALSLGVVLNDTNNEFRIVRKLWDADAGSSVPDLEPEPGAVLGNWIWHVQVVPPEQYMLFTSSIFGVVSMSLDF